MSRLRHNVKAYLLTFRMTQEDTIVFVEGAENDPIFYGEIGSRYAVETGRRVGIREATELPNAALAKRGGAGGKRTLLRAAKFMRTWRNRGKYKVDAKKQIVFCVDKDIDELLGIKQADQCLLYTRYHSVENHLIRSTNLYRALACAYSLTVQKVKEEIDGHLGIDALAIQWRDWVIRCVLVSRLQLSGTYSYSLPSKINTPSISAVDQSKLEAELLQIKLLSGLSEELFTQHLSFVSSLIDKLIAENRFDEVFKGKWYGHILFDLCNACTTLGVKCKKGGIPDLWIGIRSAFMLADEDYRYYFDLLISSNSSIDAGI